MRQLHVLGVSDDGTTLLLGTSSDAAKPSHRVAVDDRLRAAVRGQLAPPGTDRVDSALSPREIQARLRAGDTPEVVAKAAGVPVARVLPYAVPVLAERDRIVDEARAQAVHRSRGPDTTKPLGELVDAHLSEASGLKPESVEWTARRQADGAWIVSLTYSARGRKEASWLWRPTERTLTPLDPAGSRLTSEKSSRKGAARRAAVKRPAAKPATKSAVKPATKTVTKVAARSTGKPGKAATSAKRTTTAVSTPKSPSSPTAAAAPGASKSSASGGRVPLPSWSDVLLGVQAPPSRTAARRRRPSRRAKD